MTQDKDFFLPIKPDNTGPIESLPGAQDMDKNIVDPIIELSTIELDIIKEANRYRKSAGVPDLVPDNNLMITARNQSRLMNKNKKLKHSDGNKDGWMAENIAYGQRTAIEVVQSWYNSAGHRLNMLNKKYTRIGVGKSGQYWTQQFK